MERRPPKKTRRLAGCLADYPGLGGHLDELIAWHSPGLSRAEAMHGLDLNRQHARSIASLNVYRALLAAQPGTPPDSWIADAVATSFEDAEQIHADLTASFREQATIAGPRHH